MSKNNGESIFFMAPAIGIIIGSISGSKDKSEGGSGLISPFGIDLALMLGWTFGIFETIGFTVTPGIAIGRMGFIVISFGIHYKRRIGFGIVIPVFPIWG